MPVTVVSSLSELELEPVDGVVVCHPPGVTLCRDYAERCQQVHRIDWDGVAPAVACRHDDPKSLALHHLLYGAWAVPAGPLRYPHLPLGLTTYKSRALAEWTGSELELQKGLEKLFLDPRLEVTVTPPEDFFQVLSERGARGVWAPFCWPRRRPKTGWEQVSFWLWLAWGGAALGWGIFQRLLGRTSKVARCNS